MEYKRFGKTQQDHESDGQVLTDAKPWDTPWPSSGLEAVSACPACGSDLREILHEGLVDNIFHCAPGKWSQWSCLNCGSAYIDPRPTPESIHLAYVNYYTHREASTKENYVDLSVFRKIRRNLVNGYTNWRYSTRAANSNVMGVVVAFVLPMLRRVIDRQYRNLPKPSKSGASLLDVGCGDGAFLALARTCGWDVVGIDPDPKAAANAAKQGLSVYVGGVEYFHGKSEIFDVITLNHVIEHVHDPIGVLKTCFELLKPGGQIWLETPNVKCLGHTRFQKNWRGLEVPRHLVIFNRHSLKQALYYAGFREMRDCASPNSYLWVHKTSLAMEHGDIPGRPVKLSAEWAWQILRAMIISELFRDTREFISVAANKVKD